MAVPVHVAKVLTYPERVSIINQLFQLILMLIIIIRPLHNLVTWYRINYAGTQLKQWDFPNKGAFLISPVQLSFVLKLPLCYLHPSIIYSVLCDRIVRRAYCRPYEIDKLTVCENNIVSLF